MADAPDTTPDAETPELSGEIPAHGTTKPHRKRRLALKITGAIVLLAGGLVAFGPMIASPFVPGIIESSLGIPGTVKVDRASLGWFAPQVVGPITIYEKGKESGPPIATVSVKAARGLTGLLGVATGSFDLGIIEVSGSADIVRSADGTTNLERALGIGGASSQPSKSPTTPGSKPITLPKGLNATINATALRMTFTDERATASGPRTVMLDGGTITGSVVSASGGDLNVSFAAKAAEGTSLAGASGSSAHSLAGASGSSVQSGSQAIGNGTIAGSLKATGWAKADGSLALDAATIDASVALSEVPSGIVDAFVPGSTLGLPPGATIAGALGPTIGLTAEAKGKASTLDASIEAVMANVHASAKMALADKVLSLKAPMTLWVKGDAAGALVPALAAMVQAASPDGVQAVAAGDVRLNAIPDVTLAVNSLRVPLDMAKASAGSPIDLRGVAFDMTLATVNTTKGSIRLDTAAGSRPQEFEAAPVSIAISAEALSKGVHVEGGTSVVLAGNPAGTIAIDLDAKRLLDSSGAFTKGLPQLAGNVRLSGVSTALAQPLVNSTGLVLAQDLGPTIDVTIIATTDIAADAVSRKGQVAGGASSANVELKITSQNASIDAQASLTDKDIKVDSMRTTLAIAPATLQRLNPGDLALVAPANISIDLGGEGLTIPMKNGVPDVRAASNAEFVVRVPSVLLDGATMKGEDGSAKKVGRVGVENFSATLRASPGSLLAVESSVPGTASTDSGTAGKAEVELSGNLVGPEGSALGMLRGRMTVPLRGGRLEDAVKIGLSLDGISPQVAQSILPEGTIEPGMFTGVLGESVGVSVDVAITTPGKEVSNLDLAHATAKALVTVTGERLSTPRPITLDLLADRAVLTSPAEVLFTPTLAWINATFLSAKAKKPGDSGNTDEPALTLLEPVPITLNLETLTLSRPNASTDIEVTSEGEPNFGILRPGIFEFGLDVRVPRQRVRRADGTLLEIQDLKIVAAHPVGALDGTINAQVTGRVSATAPGAAPAEPSPMNLAASISRLCNGSGKIDVNNAIVNASGSLPSVPMALLDTLANEDGWFTEIIGDVADVQMKIQNVSVGPAKQGERLAESRVEFTANSPRLSANVAGTIENGAFVASKPVELRLTEITPAAGSFINAALPALGSIEKRAGVDRPAVVTISNFRYPLDGNLEHFDGVFDIDPGEARFSASTAFGDILKVVKQRTEGEVGKRLEPLNISVTKGQIVFSRYNVPLGEFTVGTEGSVNIATRTLNIVTWIPFGALSDKVAGTVKLNTGVGSAIGRILPIEGLTMIPFRTSGTFDKSGTKLDAELMAKSLIDTVRPDKILERLPGLLPNLGGPRETRPPAQEPATTPDPAPSTPPATAPPK